MGIICSISGNDGTGKTTQIKLFNEKYPDYVSLFGGLEDYGFFKEYTPSMLHKWWFEESSPDEFCDSIYKSIYNRQQEIKKSQKAISIIDKGLINFDCRIKATLVLKGLSEEEADELIKKYKEKHSIEDIENVYIFIVSNSFNEEKIRSDSYTKEEQEKYIQYEKLQEKYMKIAMKENKKIKVLHFEDGIDANFEKIKEIIIENIVEDQNREISLVGDFKYIGGTIEYIDFEIYKDSIKVSDNFKALLTLIDYLDKKNSTNAQIYNYAKNESSNVQNFNRLNNYKREMLPEVAEGTIITKNIEDYNIPDKYKNILLEIYENVINSLKDNLLLFLIHGSAGRECMHKDWSDLDLIIVLREYTFDDIEKIESFISKYDVKVGTTIYSKYEAESLLVDAKTLYSLFMLQEGKLKSTYYKDIKIPIIKYDDLVHKNMEVLPEAIHKLKRLVYKNDANDKSIIKTLNLIMKVLLIDEGIFPQTYEDVFDTFAEKYNVDRFDIESCILSDQKNYEKVIEYSRYIIENIVND